MFRHRAYHFNRYNPYITHHTRQITPVETEEKIKEYKEYIKNLAVSLSSFSNVEQFKIILGTAILTYLDTIEDECCSSNERLKANKLKIKIDDVKSTMQLVFLLKKISEKSDYSLKKCIFDGINEYYYKNALNKSNPHKKLNDIINEIVNYQTKMNKIALCFAAFQHNPKSNMSLLPKEVLFDIADKLYKM